MDAGSISADVLVIGAGAAGLSAVLNAPDGADILVVHKGNGRPGSSPWAQGGIAAALGPDDSPKLHARDTLRVGMGHGDPGVAEVLCGEAPECVLALAELGCEFDRCPDGTLDLAREGGQSVARSVHVGDATGAAIMGAMRAHARRRARSLEGHCVKLAVVDGRCHGAWVMSAAGLRMVRASSTVLATGGVGGVFPSTTNPDGATGDGIALAWEAGAAVADLEFMQFHPTTLAAGPGRQRPLLTEALRGAGAYVVDGDGRRFLFDHHGDGELAPRDVVARAVASRKSWLDCRHLGKQLLDTEFSTVTNACRIAGLDPATDLLPIEPASHYLIGGVQTDHDGRSSIPRLYAIGECATTGVHGANRLAGNSLAEAVVFGRRAARAIAAEQDGHIEPALPSLELSAAPDNLLEKSWEGLRRLTGNSLGLERTPAALERCGEEIDEMTALPPTTDPAVNELRSAAMVTRLMARAALLRTESRGVHHRRDHPEPVPEWDGIRLGFAGRGSSSETSVP